MKFLNKILLEIKKQKKVLLYVILIICFIGGGYFYWQPDKKITLAGNQILLLSENVRNFYQNKPSAWGLNTYAAIKNKIVPQDMLFGRQIKNSLGKDVLLGSDYLGNTVMPGSRVFAIVYKNLNKEECVALATLTFEEKVIISIDNIQIINDKASVFSWGSHNPLPISKSAALQACGTDNDILWNIYL